MAVAEYDAIYAVIAESFRYPAYRFTFATVPMDNAELKAAKCDKFFDA
jgi:hypothetical protein